MKAQIGSSIVCVMARTLAGGRGKVNIPKSNRSRSVSEIHISTGFASAERDLAAHLFWEAFGAKLGKTLGPSPKALAFLNRVIDPDFAIVARDAQGTLLGLAGFKTSKGALVDGGFSDLCAIYGIFGACWRSAYLSLVERDLATGVLLMDGIFVTADARGKGVGTRLLDAIKREAAAQGCREVRLDVIDTNPRARALYERAGFKAGKTQYLGPFKHIFGFSSALEMRYTLQAQS